MKLNAQVIEKMQSVNLDAVDKETLVDASGFVFDNSLPLEKRAARMLEQLKNPYCFRYGDMAIKLEFAEDGPSLQELLTGFSCGRKAGCNDPPLPDTLSRGGVILVVPPVQRYNIDVM